MWIEPAENEPTAEHSPSGANDCELARRGAFLRLWVAGVLRNPVHGRSSSLAASLLVGPAAIELRNSAYGATDARVGMTCAMKSLGEGSVDNVTRR